MAEEIDPYQLRDESDYLPDNPFSTAAAGEPVGSGETILCTSCGHDMQAEAVLCVNCGYDYRTGQRVHTVQESAAPTGTDARRTHVEVNPKAHQPHNLGLLINTDWGEPKSAYDRATAKQAGLVLYRRRWVTKEERTELKRQYVAYSAIRQMACLCFLGGIITAVFLFSERPPFIIAGPGFGLSALCCVMWIVLVLVVGVNLWRFRLWARTLLVWMLVVDLIFGVVAALAVPAVWQWPAMRVGSLLIVGSMLYWGRYKDEIFYAE